MVDCFLVPLVGLVEILYHDDILVNSVAQFRFAVPDPSRGRFLVPGCLRGGRTGGLNRLDELSRNHLLELLVEVDSIPDRDCDA